MVIRVLIADPEQALLDAYHDYLSRQGFEIETVTGGQECVERLCDWRPDVLVLEPDLPNGWGNKILDLLRQNSESNVPVLILSRRDSVSVDPPVYECHVKPFAMAELTRSIRKVTGSRLT